MTSNPNSKEFDWPRRQSPIGFLFESIYLAQKMLRTFWWLILIVIVRIDKIHLLFILISVALVLLVILFLGYRAFRNFLFGIHESEGTFILQKGIFNKKTVLLHLDKIQQVNMNQNLLQKIFQVYSVDIETAGSVKSEVLIRAVSKQVALQLQMQLLRYRAKADHPALHENVITGGQTIHILTADLLKVALTSNYLKSFSLLLAFVAAGYNSLKDVWKADKEYEKQFVNYISSLNAAQYLAYIIAAVLIFLFLFNLFWMLIAYYDLNIRMYGKSLLLSYGAFNRKSTVLHPSKVLIVKVVTNFFPTEDESAENFCFASIVRYRAG